MRAGAAMVVCLLGCSQARPVEPDVRRQCLTWRDEIAPVVAAKCTGCHGAADPAASYATDSYLDLISKATAGDAASPLLAKLDPRTADATHAAFADVHARLQTWVVDCDLGYIRSEIHSAGLMNPADPEFHGAVVARNGWDLGQCATCHGTDFAGGKSGVSCKTCHQDGPTSCTTCHGQPPATGAHVAHTAGTDLGRKLDCSECHVKPAVYTDAGHLHAGPGKVTFGALASAKAAFDATSQTCQNVYCHGGAQPKWAADPSQAACGTCHGLPPGGHAATSTRCGECHSVDAQQHVNGVVDFAAGGTGCASCHGQPPATGAHLAHAQAQHDLASPVACAECHAVPSTLASPGHADGTVQVFPAGLPGLATTGGARPAFDPSDATCSNVYCHGAARPKWSAGADAAGCGTCHGIPPADGAHAAGLKLSDCATCHPATVDGTGAIKSSAHMNGKIDVSL
jgi:predicted CxxxxCH...CXXCH cytochrome family protein